MNNRQNNKSIIAFKYGLSSFLIYCVWLLFVILFSTEVISEDNRIGPILYFSVLTLIFISFILGWIAIIHSSVKNYFGKLGLSYGIFTLVIWLFLGLSFFVFIITHFACATVTLKQKMLFFVILAILSLAPLVLHILLRAKFTKNT